VAPGRIPEPRSAAATGSDQKEQDEMRSLIRAQARTISNLEAERNSLAASVEELKQLEPSKLYR
jgi:hypothetical protein